MKKNMLIFFKTQEMDIKLIIVWEIIIKIIMLRVMLFAKFYANNF